MLGVIRSVGPFVLNTFNTEMKYSLCPDDRKSDSWQLHDKTRSRKIMSSLLINLILKSTYFVIYVCDIHAVEDIILEVVPQYPSQNIERYVGPVHRL